MNERLQILKVLKTKLVKNLDNFIQRIEKQKEIYCRIHERYDGVQDRIINLEDDSDCADIIANFGPYLPQNKAKIPLSELFVASYHPASGALIIANKGASLLSKAPISGKHFLIYQLGCLIFNPRSGQEIVNIGVVGNIHEGSVIVRGESACAPSFLFATESCNCCYQWKSALELASHLNPAKIPDITSGNISGTTSGKKSGPSETLEWVAKQFSFTNKGIRSHHNGQGLVLIHLDSQSGMGAGFTADEFCYDLYSRALLRQLGENTLAQSHLTTIKEGCELLGLVPDARKMENGAGYQLVPIVLDFLLASRDIILLSNNKNKISALEEYGYRCRRIKTLGNISALGMLEAKQRKEDFNHLDIGDDLVSFEDESLRLLQEVMG